MEEFLQIPVSYINKQKVKYDEIYMLDSIHKQKSKNSQHSSSNNLKFKRRKEALDSSRIVIENISSEDEVEDGKNGYVININGTNDRMS